MTVFLIIDPAIYFSSISQMVYHYRIVFDTATKLNPEEINYLVSNYHPVEHTNIYDRYRTDSVYTKDSSKATEGHSDTSSSNQTRFSDKLQDSILERKRDTWCTKALQINNVFLDFDKEKVAIDKLRQEYPEQYITKDKKSSAFSKKGHDFAELDQDIIAELDKHFSVDWRFGKIEISGLDLDKLHLNTNNKNMGENKGSNISEDMNDQAPPAYMSESTTTSVPPSTNARQSRSKSIGLNARPDLLFAKFLGYGVVRLYRDDSEVQQDLSAEGWKGSSKKKLKSDDKQRLEFAQNDSSKNNNTTLAILAVPSYLTSYDLIGFLGSNVRDNVSHIRMVRTSQPNRYLVLMKFRTTDMAARFYEEYNGKLFNAMEAETCQVIYVNKIEFRDANKSKYDHSVLSNPHSTNDDHVTLAERLGRNSIPASNSLPVNAALLARVPTSTPAPNSYLLDDPFTLNAIDDEDTEEEEENISEHAEIRHNFPTKPAPPPTSNLTELPTCPVCLERMDATATGLLTIPCLHTFHCQCLSKWKDGSCPVCRYSQREAEKGPGQCAVCQSNAHLWICLICGHIGCGRYDNAHAIDHYEATGHCYAMDMESQRVWDYLSDSYVHRLLQNQVDGKLVELPNRISRSGSSGEGSSFSQGPRSNNADSGAAYDVANAAIKAADVSEKKLNDMSIHLTQLLSSQLESQRDYYESLIMAASDKMTDAITRASAAEKENENLKQSVNLYRDETIPMLRKELEQTRKAADKMRKLAEKLEALYTEEKLIGEQTIQKLKRLEESAASRDAEITELNDTVRDLMFFHEAQAKLQNVDEDIKQGTIMVPMNNTSEKKNTHGKTKGKTKEKRR